MQNWKEVARSTGWNVFPIKIELIGTKWNKRPLVAGWQNITAAQIDALPWDGANGFGIRTGGAGGLYVIDVDDYKDGSEAGTWLAERGLNGHTRTHQTVSGGVHKLYTLPANVNLRNRANVVFGLDTRGDGGFIAYGEGYSLLDESPPAPLPATICAELDTGAAVERDETDHAEFEAVTPSADLIERVFSADMGGALGVMPNKSNALFKLAARMKSTGFTPSEFASTVYGLTQSAREHVTKQKRPRRAMARAWDDAGPSLADNLAAMPEVPELPPEAKPVAEVTEVVSFDDPVLSLAAMLSLAMDKRVPIDVRDHQVTMQAVVEKYFTVNGKLTLVAWQGEFYRWMGTHWEAVEDGWVDDLCSHVFSKIFCTVSEKTDKDGNVTLTRHPVNATIPFVRNHIAALQAVTRRPRGAMMGWPDGRVGTWQAVQNGILDLDTGKLCGHDPDFFNLTHVDAPWMPDASLTGTHMEGFLTDLLAWGDQITLAQEVFGYILSGDTSLQKAFMVIGQRRSGKGTLMRVWRALLGGEVASIKSNQLGDKFSLEGSIGKSLMLVPDVRLNKDSDFSAIAEMILTVTGEDHVDVPRKNRTAWSGPTTIRMVMSSNSVPMLRDEDGVLASRFIYLACPNSFYGKEDPKLLDNLLAERGVILKWAVDGWKRLQTQRRFTESQTHKNMVSDAETRMDPIGAFIGHYLEVTGNAEDFLSTDELFTVFNLFCSSVDVGHHTKDGFSKKLNAKQTMRIQRTVRDSGTQRGYSGLKWRSQ